MECNLCNIKNEEYRIIKKTKHSICCVNLEPIIEGHVMIIPINHKKSYSEFTPEEAQDFLNLIEESSRILRKAYMKQGALTIVNHGVNQSQEHIHLHIMPVNEKEGTRDILCNFFNVPYRQKAEVEQLTNIKKHIIKFN